ncbi:MAG: hypothetical protein ACOZQL_03490 [Myxococcota bacterium]
MDTSLNIPPAVILPDETYRIRWIIPLNATELLHRKESLESLLEYLDSSNRDRFDALLNIKGDTA